MTARPVINFRNKPAYLIRDHPKYPVYVVSDSGRFVVYYRNQWHLRNTMAAIDKLIKVQRFLKVLQFDTPEISHRASSYVRKVMAVDGPNSFTQLSGSVVRYVDLYLYSDNLVKEIKAIEKDRVRMEKEINARIAKIRKRAIRVGLGNFQKLLVKHGQTE